MIIDFLSKKDYDLSMMSPVNRQLIRAIVENDQVEFKSALDKGANVDAHEGLPVIAAVLHHCSAMVKELYEREANFAVALQTLKETNNELYRIKEGYQKISRLSKEDADVLRNLYAPVGEMIEAYRTGLDNIMMRRQANAFNQVAEKVNGLEQKFETIATLLAPQQISKKGLDR